MKKGHIIIHDNTENVDLQMKTDKLKIDEIIQASLKILHQIDVDEQIKYTEEILASNEKNISRGVTLKKAEIDLRYQKFSLPHLDIGGSGEKIIYNASYPNKLAIIDIAFDDIIDSARAECYEMDASEMKFENNTFNTITSFYTFLYMNEDKLEKSLKECFRVLNVGGLLYIWDICIESVKENSVIFAPLNVKFRDVKKEVTYGSSEIRLIRNKYFYLNIMNDIGFLLKLIEVKCNSIFIVAQKGIEA